MNDYFLLFTLPIPAKDKSLQKSSVSTHLNKIRHDSVTLIPAFPFSSNSVTCFNENVLLCSKL